MNENSILEGTNGVLGRYSINQVNYNSTAGVIEVGLVFSAYVMAQTININVTSSDFFEKERKEKLYKKRKSITKKLLG